MRSIDVEPGNEWFVTGSADRVIKVIFKFHFITNFSILMHILIVKMTFP